MMTCCILFDPCRTLFFLSRLSTSRGFARCDANTMLLSRDRTKASKTLSCNQWWFSQVKCSRRPNSLFLLQVDTGSHDQNDHDHDDRCNLNTNPHHQHPHDPYDHHHCEHNPLNVLTTTIIIILCKITSLKVLSTILPRSSWPRSSSHCPSSWW